MGQRRERLLDQDPGLPPMDVVEQLLPRENRWMDAAGRLALGLVRLRKKAMEPLSAAESRAEMDPWLAVGLSDGSSAAARRRRCFRYPGWPGFQSPMKS